MRVADEEREPGSATRASAAAPEPVVADPPAVDGSGGRSGSAWNPFEPGVRGRGAAALAVAAVLVATATLAAVFASHRTEPAAPSTGAHRVDVVGDSLVHQAGVPLRTGLVAAGYEASVVGLPSQSLSSEGIRARLDDVFRDRGEVLVLATTTNDVRDNVATDGWRPNAPSYRDQITALLDRFGDRCVVMVNARDRTNAIFLPERAVVLNAELTRLERENGNLVLVDWATLSRDLPTEWFSNDQLHFGSNPEEETPESPSAQRYADAIVEGVRKCRERSAGRGSGQGESSPR